MKPLLGWHGARLTFLALFLIALLRVKTINLADSPKTAIADYGHRWGIETLFGMFKTRGFCLESTHFIHEERLSKLIALMALAMCWGMKVGQWLHSHTPIKIKKHGRRERSLFRYGLDHLRSIVNDLDLKHSEFLECLQFLSCT